MDFQVQLIVKPIVGCLPIIFFIIINTEDSCIGTDFLDESV